MGAGTGVVRLAFVLLRWLYLIGPILCVALWIAMPAEPEPQAAATTPAGEGVAGRTRRRTEGGIALMRSPLVDLAGRVKRAALASLDETRLHPVFVGEALQAEPEAVQQLRAAGAHRTQRLLHRDIVRVASNGSAGVVEMVARWHMEPRSLIIGECVAFPDHAVPQTVHLARTADGWGVARIDSHQPAEPVAQGCSA